jgi:heme exporter protein B
MNAFVALVARDLRLAVVQGGAATMAGLFFVLVVLLFPLGVGPEGAVLARIAAGVVWVAALLSVLLSLDRLFQADFEDGSLDHLLLGPLPPIALVLAKTLAHWLTTGLPLTVLAPLLALLLNLEPAALGVLVLAMALGTPTLSLIGAVGAALTVAVRRGGVLLALIVVPLFIPALIFGAGAVEAAATGLAPAPHLLLLAANGLLALVFAPWAAAAALRLAAE